MVASTGKFDIAGVEICYRQWLPEGDTRAVVQLVHGLAEHSGRYGELAAQMNSAGYAVCALDLPGHGKSAGEPGYIASFDHYVDAVLALRARLGQQYPQLPVFLLGHSMGGLVSALAVWPERVSANVGCSSICMSYLLLQPTVKSPGVENAVRVEGFFETLL